MKKSPYRFFRKWYTITGLVIVVIIVVFVLKHGPKQAVYDAATVSVGTVTEKVSVTGKVSPLEKADLAFEKSGVMTKISVAVGDMVKKGAVLGSLDSAGDQAKVAIEQAKLADLTRSLRPEEYAAEKAKVDSASIVYENAKKDALNAARTSFVQVQTAIVNYADTMFTDPQSVNPQIAIHTQSFIEENNINYERIQVGDALTSWQNALNSATTTAAAPTLLLQAENAATLVKTFLTNLSDIVNNLTPATAGLSQSQINALLSTVNTSLSTFNTAQTALTAAASELDNASSALDQAQNNFTLKVAGSSAQTIAAESAAVAAARAELAKDTLTSPIDGQVTQVVPNLGEFVSPGSTAFAVQSAGSYKIEAFVPEADIAKVAVGNTASITLDAYGSSVVFPAHVTMIDPAETVLEGVPTYKVTLVFDTPDDRVRSGMTANTDILTHEARNVLFIPTRALVDMGEGKGVRVIGADPNTWTTVPVTVGLKGSDGTSEIINGLQAGQKVVTYVK